jgi:hypothetical protein
MASTITAGNGTNNGIAILGDNTGTLNILSGPGGGTTAIAIDASQNVTVAGTLTASGGFVGTSAGNPQMSFASYPTTVFNSTGTPMVNISTGTFNWTCPTGVTKVMVSVIGGGGGGQVSYPYGGGGGGTAVGVYTVVPGTVYAVTVGAGGAGSVAGTGVSGGSSSFSSFCSATGGTGSYAGGYGSLGAGTNGNIRNSVASALNFPGFYVPPHVASFAAGGVLTNFAAGYVNNNDSQTTSATNWTINSKSYPGAAGSDIYGSGGVSGIVLITWVG